MDKKFTPLESLQFKLWDVYKSAYDRRPRHLTETEWQDEILLNRLISQCERAIIANINEGN